MEATEVKGGLPEHVLQHREKFQDYVLNHSESWLRPFLVCFYEHWHNWNNQFFDNEMTPPYILIAEPSSPRFWGDCSRISGFGGRSQIRIRPSVLSGKATNVRSGVEFFEGRKRIGADIVLHEMIHQWAQEVTCINEASFSGHGNNFRDKCNEIGRVLGLPPVRNSKKRGKDKDLPSCSFWPHVVRPKDYYLGALIPNVTSVESKDPDSDEEEIEPTHTIPIPLDPQKAAVVLKEHFKRERLSELLVNLKR